MTFNTVKITRSEATDRLRWLEINMPQRSLNSPGEERNGNRYIMMHNRNDDDLSRYDFYVRFKRTKIDAKLITIYALKFGG